ncbi:MAG: VWA domain-containing protein [Limisphaerales bacterium]
MNRRLSWLCLAGGFLAPVLTAQPVAPLAESATAYLFLVDTSFSMRREEVTVRNLAYDLVRSGLSGRMRAGDGFAIWTFNDEVQTDRFPPQSWLPELNQALAKRTYEFLKRQRSEKQTRMDKAVTAVTKLMRATGSLTVFLITDGDDAVEGTPFDRDLNLIYLHRYRELRKARKPFVTTLVAHNGRWVAWAVNGAGEPLTIPDEPARAALGAVPPASPPTASPSPTPAPASPVKHEPAASAAATPAPPPTATAVPPVVTSVESTPKPAATAPLAVPKPVAVAPPSAPGQPTPAAVPPATNEVGSPPKTVAPTVPVPPPLGEKSNPLPAPATVMPDQPRVTPTASEKKPPRQPAPSSTQPVASNIASPKPRPGQTAVVSPLAPASGRGLLAIGVASLLLACGLMWFWFRRGHVRRASSLITRSIDSHRK